MAMAIDMKTIMSAEGDQRATLLKTRFAGIIYKACHRGETIDPKKMEQEVKAVQLKRKREDEVELKRTRESLKRRRESEKRAREELERTVVIDDNYAVFKFMEELCGPGYLVGF